MLNRITLNKGYGAQALAVTRQNILPSGSQTMPQFSASHSPVLYVSKNGPIDGTADGLSWATAWPELDQINWATVQAAANAYARQMADPHSLEALGYRYIALKAQALQAKLPTEERTKISSMPIMTPAHNLAQIYAPQNASIRTKQLPTKRKQ